MSFFDDFVKSFNINDLTKECVVTVIIDVGISVVGDFKIVQFSETLIILKLKNYNLKIVGECLKVESISKGEIIISGNVTKCFRGDNEK